MGDKKYSRTEKEEPMTLIILKETIGTTLRRVFEGIKGTGFVTTLLADPDNTGIIFLGKGLKDRCTFPLSAKDSQVTEADLDKLMCYSDTASQYLHVWAEKK